MVQYRAIGIGCYMRAHRRVGSEDSMIVMEMCTRWGNELRDVLKQLQWMKVKACPTVLIGF